MTVAGVAWDPFAHSGLDNPFSTYQALREKHPVYHNHDRGVWALTRFDDVQRAARDWGTFSNAAGVDLDDTTEVFGPGNFIDSDPRRHDELRGLVRHRFTPKAVADLDAATRPVASSRCASQSIRDRARPATRGPFGIAPQAAAPVRQAIRSNRNRARAAAQTTLRVHTP